MSVEAAIPQIPEVPAPPETTSDEPAPNLPTAVAPPEVPDASSPVDETSSSSEPPQVDASAPEAKRRGRPAGAKNKPKIERVSVKKVTIETPQPSAPPPSPVAGGTCGEPVRLPTPAPQLNITDMLRETLRKMQAERQQQQSNLYANLARSG